MGSDGARRRQTRPTEVLAGTRRRDVLTREQVLNAALKIIDEEGVEALTMRRLGQALDRNPMAIYRHAADKDAVLDAVVEQVSAGFVGFGTPDARWNGNPKAADPESAAGRAPDWEEALRRAAHAFRRVALAHPHVIPLLITRRMSGPLSQRPLGTLRPLEELLEVFISAGFDSRGALHAARLFTGFLQGHVQDELQERVYDPDETDDVMRMGLHRLPITQFPRLRSLATVLAAYDGAAELDEGLDVVIAGLRSQLLN